MMEGRPLDFHTLTQSLSEEERLALIHWLGTRELQAVNFDFRNWAHEGQLSPDGDWRTWIIMAGRGFGKTRAGAEWVARLARQSGDLRIALVAATIEEARRVMVEGQSGLLAVAGKDQIDHWMPSRRLLRFTSGAEATLFSGASPEMLRGPEHHIAWCDELAKWEKPGECWDMLQLGMRLGALPRVLVTTTPKPGPVLEAIMTQKGTVQTGGSTRANPHLPRAFVEGVEDMYAGTRLGRQELDGEWLPDVAGALWSVELLERCRLVSATALPPAHFARTVIGIDPPSGDGTCGIIACALGGDGMAYVLGDHSVTARSPEGWAQAVAAAAQVHSAQLVVAETNQGGQMVEAVLRHVDAGLAVKAVHAHWGKSDRATPIATAFEAGKVKLCGRFPDLEAQLCGLIAGGGYEGLGRSPDRADAMVWALSELMPAKVVEPRVRVLF